MSKSWVPNWVNHLLSEKMWDACRYHSGFLFKKEISCIVFKGMRQIKYFLEGDF